MIWVKILAQICIIISMENSQRIHCIPSVSSGEPTPQRAKTEVDQKSIYSYGRDRGGGGGGGW